TVALDTAARPLYPALRPPDHLTRPGGARWCGLRWEAVMNLDVNTRHQSTRRAYLATAATFVGSSALAAACGVSGGERPATSAEPKTIVYYTKWTSGARAEVIKQALAEWS